MEAFAMSKTKWLLSITLAVMILVLLAACAGASPSPALDGTSWKLVSMGDRAPIPGTTITINFTDGQVSGASGCNHYGGEYQARGDEITFSNLTPTTEMACLEDVAAQEASYLDFLAAAQSFQLTDGQLLIFGPDGAALTFVPQE
jgi:heat shock protein HslJ